MKNTDTNTALDRSSVNAQILSREITVEGFSYEKAMSAVVAVKTHGFIGFDDVTRKYGATFRKEGVRVVCELMKLGADDATPGDGEDREAALADAINALYPL